MAKLTEKRKQELVDVVIERIKTDIYNEDTEALDELLKFIPAKNLLCYLPEEMWTKFPEVKVQ